MHDHDDFDFEDSPGIPAPLPPGEHVVWQGSPDAWEIAKSAFHIRKVTAYFVLILGVQVMSTINSGGQESLAASLSLTVLLTLLGLGILSLLAYLTARVTIYTVTNRRILIRFGIALQMTINLPFSQIKAADMRVSKNGFGDIPLSLKPAKRVSYLVLWPHVRPWNFARPQPMLRGIANVQRVAHIIADVAAKMPIENPETNSESGARESQSNTQVDSVLPQTELSS